MKRVADVKNLILYDNELEDLMKLGRVSSRYDITIGSNGLP